MAGKLVAHGLAIVNGGKSAPIKISGESFDQIFFRLSQGNTTNKLLIANLDKLKINMQIKLADRSIISIDCRFIDLMQFSNFRAGYAGSDTEYEYQAILDKYVTGTIIKDEYIEIIIQVYMTSALGALDSSPVIDIEVDRTDKTGDYPCHKIESINFTGELTFPLTTALFQCDAGANRTIKLRGLPEGDVDVIDSIQISKSKLLANFEANTSFGLIWSDNIGVGQDQKVILPTALNYLIISRI